MQLTTLQNICNTIRDSENACVVFWQRMRVQSRTLALFARLVSAYTILSVVVELTFAQTNPTLFTPHLMDMCFGLS
jgi:hypothetical protein